MTRHALLADASPGQGDRPCLPIDVVRGRTLDPQRIGGRGGPWEVVAGAIRLERRLDDGALVTCLALPGDLVGFEPVVDEAFQFTVRALVSSRLEPVKGPAGQTDRALLARVVRQQQRQFADAARLRTGSAQVRVSALLALLGRRASVAPVAPVLPQRQCLPALRDMSVLLDLAPETICRELSAIYPKAETALPSRGRRPAPLAAPRVAAVAASRSLAPRSRAVVLP